MITLTHNKSNKKRSQNREFPYLDNSINNNVSFSKFSSIFGIYFVVVIFVWLFIWNEMNILFDAVKAQQQQGNIIHTTTKLSQSRYGLVATSSNELVFFAGGLSSTGASDQVDIYNVTSGSWTTATLSIPRYNLAATSSQNLVFFGGGWDGTTFYDRVDIYNTLNGSWSTATLSLNLVIVLQPLLLGILFSLEVVVIQLFISMLLMCLM
jgi:hypothetical protein